MYSDSELASAAKAGILHEDQLTALRAHIAALRGEGSTADEEQVRLITGFNDIFVTIACGLVIFAASMLGVIKHAIKYEDYTHVDYAYWRSGLLVAVASWLMAEMFTRKRRMALPSIVLLLSFVIGLGFFAGDLVQANMARHDVWHEYKFGFYGSKGDTTHELYPWQIALITAASAIAAGMGAMAHWRRFRVPITIAAVTGAMVLLLLAGVAALTNTDLASNTFIAPAAMLCGLGVFAFAMRWDLADPARTSQKADIAFWLHLLAAPLIAHPLFYWMGVTGGGAMGAGKVAGVLSVYVLFALVALAVDRRALLVSALAYVLGALTQLFHDYGNVEMTVALTALVIGSALLALSAYWGIIRRAVLARLPARISALMPHASA